MADLENEVNEQEEFSEEDSGEEKSGKKFSFVKMGLPILLVQVVIAYLLANYVIVPKLYGNSDSTAQASATENAVADSAESEDSGETPEFGKIFTIEDVIVNPAESEGGQFVLINFGFEVKDDSDIKTLEERQIQVRDFLIKILSAKTVTQLDGPDDKEVLRQEVKAAVKDLLPPKHLMNVYFSNYIIQ